MDPNVVPDDFEDDDFTPPVAVRVDHAISICPSCSRPLAKHDSMALLRCTQDLATDDEAAEVAAAVSAPAAASAPPPTPASVFVEDIIARRHNPEPEPPPPSPLDFIDGRKIPTVDKQRGMVVLPSRELDFEELAAALRTVIETERDEIVRRGGPLEKQNAELKERLADALEDAAMWRRRAQAAFEARNTAQEQYDRLVKANRKTRNEERSAKERNHTRVLDSAGILAKVQSTKGFTVERAGNGHFIIKKAGLFITDMASSGQGTKVNMATRVALRKAGIDV